MRVLRSVSALALLLLVLPTAGEAKKLRHKATGFATVAPRAFKLERSEDGVQIFGTSAAAPHTGAVAALMLSKNPTLSPRRLRRS